MKKFEKNIDDRKVLVARLSQLTGLDARYTFVPRCAYVIGTFTVEKDGRLTVEDGADESILETLKVEEMIGAELEASAPVLPFTPVRQEAASPAPITADLGTEEWGDDDWEEGSQKAEAEDHQEVWQPETDIFAEAETGTEQAAEEAESEADAPGAGEEAEAADWVPDAEYEQEAAEESAASLGVRDADEAPGFPLDAQISFPLSRHTVASLTNLICMIHTRGPLLSKATRGTFHVDKELVDDILDRHTFTKPSELISFVQGWTGSDKSLEGISFDADKVIFDGFTEVRDAEHLQTFMKLAAAMNKMAQAQKRVQAKDTDDSNEKYSLRVWLVRLGMNGSDYKAERKILMANLSGHAAFRTKADEEKWKARQQAKKLALRAAKEEAGTAE